MDSLLLQPLPLMDLSCWLLQLMVRLGSECAEALERGSELWEFPGFESLLDLAYATWSSGPARCLEESRGWAMACPT